MICGCQQLSEDFIREFQNDKDLIWWRISKFQRLSKEFIIEFSDKIDFECLLDNKNVSDEIKEFCRMFI